MKKAFGKMKFYDIHRHDQFSLFDGFGSAEQVAKKAKELGYPAVGSTNHGNITGLIKHFVACSNNEIIPILGCEFYFQPKINNGKYFHLCLYAKNKIGWENLNRLITMSNQETNFYYHNKICFSDLEEFNEGIVCSTACIAGFIPQAIIQNKDEVVKKAIKKFKGIFGNNFFFEIMPIELPDDKGKGKENIQIKLNDKLLKLANEYNINVIATTDSHFVDKEDFDTYLKMHAIKKTEIGFHYRERYMPTQKEMEKRLKKYHSEYYEAIQKGMNKFLDTIGDAREWFVFEASIPSYSDTPEHSYKMMKNKCINFLKENGKTSDKYINRLKKEFEVIKFHGFQDYFMIVQEYVNWARSHGIAVGPGRGSAGNSLTNYALGITKVDPIYFDNNFDRFLRKDKKKFPDIDVDFGQDKRDKVINHIIEKYKNRAAQTITYGCYNIKNLVNDLVKVCGCEEKEEKEKIVKFLSQYCDDNESSIKDELFQDKYYHVYNSKYDNIILHFTKLYGKIRFFGTHASSVILCNGDIASQAGLCRIGGNLRTSFDLHDIEYIKLLKLDILGLSSATKAKLLEDMTGEEFSYDMLNDKSTLKNFECGNACVFQFESKTANDIASAIGIESFEDVVVATSINRPGPLSLKMHEKYRNAKIDPDISSPWYKFTKNTYGTIIYQEQGMEICKEIGKLDAEITDKIIKLDYTHMPKDKLNEWWKLFKKGAKEYGLSKEQTKEIFSSLIQYSFNRGHGVAYAMLSSELMYFRTHHPFEFWYATLKYENKEDKLFNEEQQAINDGCIIFTPHVNGPSKYGIVDFDGEKVIQKGLTTIKGVGEKAAEYIVNERKQNGPFIDVFEFEKRCKSRCITSRVIDALEDNGALEFNKKKYYDKVKKYNISIISRG